MFTLAASEAVFNIARVVFSFVLSIFSSWCVRTMIQPIHTGIWVIWLASAKRDEFYEFFYKKMGNVS